MIRLQNNFALPDNLNINNGSYSFGAKLRQAELNVTAGILANTYLPKSSPLLPLQIFDTILIHIIEHKRFLIIKRKKTISV
jgi:hypothetical protein